jgi:DNA/RNA endonuclease YhcR with UshA esterase domain
VPVVRFSQASYNTVENDGTATVTVTLSSESSETVTIDYATNDQTGEAGSDYVSASGRLTFLPGTTSQSFTLELIDDSVDNEDKSVNLVLSNPKALRK